MKKYQTIFLTLLFTLIAVQISFSQVKPINLWEKDVPLATGSEAIDNPTITPFFPAKEKVNGAAIIVCPGGGYGHLSDVKEGSMVAEWLNSLGITAFVLKYRLGPKYKHPAMLDDVSRAMRLVRSRAKEWSLDTKHIGILGFSAGGHLASTLATHFDSGKADSKDEVERMSSRPDVQILIYPVITMGEFTHAGSKKNLLGENPSPELVKLMSNELQVTKETPPAFLVHTTTDTAVPVENSIQFANALRKNGVPFEMHIYEQGPHGFGLGGDKFPILASWQARCADWLGLHGFTATKK